MTAFRAQSRFSNDLRYRSEDHPSQTQLTPERVLGLVREAFGGEIDTDPCTIPSNPVGATTFYCPPTDGAAESWFGGAFVNPPYGKARDRWVRRCIAHGERDGHPCILLMPAATDTRIFQAAAESADGVVFVKGRLKFDVLRPNRRQVAASHPSALFVWNANIEPLVQLGLVQTSVARA